jgi:hypothetical protein
MSDPAAYSYESPLKGVDQSIPLSEERNEDGKSYKNPPREGLSKSYEEFPDPLDKGIRGGLFVSPRTRP